MVVLGFSWLGHGVAIASREHGWLCSMVQVKTSLSNILSNINVGNIWENLGPVKTARK